MLCYRKGRAPEALTRLQATPGATWDDVRGNDKQMIREALVRDQGALCGYCQRRITASQDAMKVEHWNPQSRGDGDSLTWSNLIGVCLGDATREGDADHSGVQHCDTSRGDEALRLHPVEGQGLNPRDYLRYTASGEVCSEDGRAKRDIETLNLNALRLKRGREHVYTALKRLLDRQNAKGVAYSEASLRRELQAATLRPGEQTPEYCEMVRYVVQRWLRQVGRRG